MADEVVEVKREALTPRRRVAAIVIELLPVVVVVFAGIIALSHIVDSGWERSFFYNGDSIMLPIIEESIQRGEGFGWVFSSQNFFFPEGILYFFSTLFTDSPRVALLINAILNLVCLYVLLRVIAHQLSHHSRHRFVEITIATTCVLLFIMFVLLEPTDSINRSGIATLFLFTTYYYGVVLVGLLVISLTLWATRLLAPSPWNTRRYLAYAITVALLTGLASFSDPLYLAQVVAPFAVAALLLVFMRRMSWRNLLMLAIPAAAGTLLAVVLRRIFVNMFASSLGGYFQLDNIDAAWENIAETVAQMLSSAPGSLKLIMLTGILLVNAIIFVYILYSRGRAEVAAKISNSEVFIVGLVTASSVSLLVGQVITGSVTTRYLLPIFVFPLLTALLVGVYALRRMLAEVERADLRRSLSTFLVGVAAAASSVIIAVGIINVPAIASASDEPPTPDIQCFNEFVDGRDVDGVGGFWTVRTLDVYGDTDGVVLQVDEYLHVFRWLINVDSYRDRDFSFVIVDQTERVPVSSLEPLGEPAAIYECPNYDIWDYEGTPGQQILNDTVGESLEPGFGR